MKIKKPCYSMHLSNQSVLQEDVEERRMKKLQKQLNNHIIIVGYGMIGRVVVKALLAKDHPQEQLVVIDKQGSAIQKVAKDDLIGLLGDALQEAVLTKAAITKAKHIIIATSNDAANVLISLTARETNKSIKIIARANQMENIKHIKRSGADIIISPSVAGGHLMAVATQHEQLALLLKDMITAEHCIRSGERKVK